MKIIKKLASAVAAVAALAACIGFGAAPAMAEGYGATVTVEGSTATATVAFSPQEIAQYGEYVYAEVDGELVSAVIPAASIDHAEQFYAGQVTQEQPNVTFTFKLTEEAACKGGTTAYNLYLGRNKVQGSNNGDLTDEQVKEAGLSKVLYSNSVTIPATGECTTGSAGATGTTGTTGSGNGTPLAQTGATVMPYAITVALLAAAAVAMFAVRKQVKR